MLAAEATFSTTGGPFGQKRVVRPTQWILIPSFTVYNMDWPRRDRSFVVNLSSGSVGLMSAYYVVRSVNFHLRLAAAGGRLRLIEQYLYDHRNDVRPSRITAWTPPAGYNAKVMVDLATLLEADHQYTLDIRRRQALAKRLLINGDHAHRGGDRQAASAAFREARRLDPEAQLDDLSRVRSLAWILFGPLGSADLWSMGRMVRKWIRLVIRTA